MANQWVIPDIHACSNTLKQLIEVQIKPQKGDELYFLGDYIDRGPDSKGVIDYLMSFKSRDFQSHFLMGNHEEYFLKAFEQESSQKPFLGFRKKNRQKKAWFAHGGETFLESFGEVNLNNIPATYVEWIKNLKLYIVLKDYVLVHAGLNFKNENPFEDKSDMLWTRDFNIEPAKIDDRTIIHGHVPVHIDFINLCIRKKDYHFIDLDNGVYVTNKEGFGTLTAFELNSKTLLTQNNIDL
jgi:serine/threonine protein phosphatase 1